ncbi:protein transporter Sec31 [Streptomyces sp. OUCMDZ-4982]|uniref:protein transporter Sec31 n=1 Tax=Streptomyces sp. OUCMDZ-4982 TaxID=2973090 RepID=UPI00215C3E8D|nr:protein transporter Sec31 [Streptomyces sp. OUCMDZ-4982]MCR8947144.1 protein transporter Sec31 [Streptomyces sp. OUCMDZ-4982]
MPTEHPAEQQQLLPGVEYRPETRQRLVPHAVNGKTRLVEEDYEVMVPVPPRDWDQAVTTAVTAAAALLVTVAVVWSVASIGDLLARAVVAPIAYLAACAFALAWVTCMALEWLARYDAARAAAPRRAGNWALIADMAVVAAHGWVEEALYVGLAGAAVSALAKKMWSTVMAHQARPLPALTAQWLRDEEADISARLALGARTRHLARIESQAALYAPTTPAALAQDTGRDSAGQLSPTVRSAVLAVLATLPGVSHDDVLTHLERLGLEYDETAVRAFLDSQDSRPEPHTVPLTPPPKSVTDSVRTLLDLGVRDKDKAVSHIHKIHGTAVPRATVVRLFNRELEKLGKSA